jgi:hypothetical protein
MTTSLRIHKVSLHFRAVALAKQLWISLLHNLHSRGLIDIATGENFELHSTTDIIDEVRSLVLGPKTWSKAWSSSAVLKRQSVLRFSEEISPNASACLLPGGRYLVLHENASLKFLDAATGERKLSYTHQVPIGSWAFDTRSGPDKWSIVVAESDPIRCVSLIQTSSPTQTSASRA